MPTVNDVLRGVLYRVGAAGGSIGMGREVRRVVHVQSSDELFSPVGEGDLVLYAPTHSVHSPDQSQTRMLRTLLNSGVAGVVTNFEPDQDMGQSLERLPTPLIVVTSELDIDELYARLLRSLDVADALISRERGEVWHEFTDLVRAGASEHMLLQRLVEITGKAAVLHGPNARVQDCAHAVLQGMPPDFVLDAIEVSDADVQRWLVDTPNPALHNVLYLELARHELVRLFAPLWIDGRYAGGLSVVGYPDQISARDRVVLLAAVRAISTVLGRTPLEVPGPIKGRRCLLLAVCAVSVSLEQLADVARRVLPEHVRLLQPREEHLALAVSDEGCEPWHRRHLLSAWQSSMATEVGTVSIGYADYWGGSGPELERALVCAGEALIAGDRRHGPGHITSYVDAQLARFVDSNRRVADLRTLYERVIGRLAQEDPKRERGLVDTLDAYCETVSTSGAAERLNVHRNTVQYRLKHIQETTSLDLNDGASRLLLQLGLLAGRFAGDVHHHMAAPEVNHSVLDLLGVA